MIFTLHIFDTTLLFDKKTVTRTNLQVKKILTGQFIM